MEKVTHGMAGFMGSHLGLKLSTAALITHSEIRINGHLVCVKERLAEGGFGLVDLVTEPATNTDYVLKRCGIQRREVFETVQKEIKILQQFAGPYLVEYCGSEIIENNGTREALILLKYCPGGHLLEKLKSLNGSHPPIGSVYKIFGQLLLALKPFHGHNPPVVHRDLKLENVLFGPDGSVRLCDFGSCCIGHTFLRTADERAAAEEVIGKETTQMYRAPEMVDLYRRNLLTEKTDIWALGCIFYALCYLTHPFQDASNLGILNARIKLHREVSIPADAVTLMMRMLDVDPEARPSVPQLFDAVSEIACDRSLPPYTLTEDALKCRAERLEAEKREKTRFRVQKKAAPVPVVPKRAVASVLSSNSVAAKRLAAKKGVPVTSVGGVASASAAAGAAVPASVLLQGDESEDDHQEDYDSNHHSLHQPPVASTQAPHFEVFEADFSSDFDALHVGIGATTVESLFEFEEFPDAISVQRGGKSSSFGATAEQFDLFEHPLPERVHGARLDVDSFDASSMVSGSSAEVSRTASGFDEFNTDLLDSYDGAGIAAIPDVSGGKWDEFGDFPTNHSKKTAPDVFGSRSIESDVSEDPFGVFVAHSSSTVPAPRSPHVHGHLNESVPKPSMVTEPSVLSEQYYLPSEALKPPSRDFSDLRSTVSAPLPKPPKPAKPPKPSPAASTLQRNTVQTNTLLDLDSVDPTVAAKAGTAQTQAALADPVSLLDMDMDIESTFAHTPGQATSQNANILNLFDTYTPVTCTKHNL